MHNLKTNFDKFFNIPKSFKEEYRSLLLEFGITIDERYFP